MKSKGESNFHTVCRVDDIPDVLTDPLTAVVTQPFEEDVLGLGISLSEVRLIGTFNSADDIDGDAVQDLSDNCPFKSNPLQENNGAFQNSTPFSDAFGDRCQCGEAEGSPPTGDGAIFQADFDRTRDFLTGVIQDPTGEIEERCSVVGTPACNIRDLLFLKKALETSDASLLGIRRCDAALSPPS